MSSPSDASVSLRQFSINPRFHSIVSGQRVSHFVPFSSPFPPESAAILRLKWTELRDASTPVRRISTEAGL